MFRQFAPLLCQKQKWIYVRVTPVLQCRTPVQIRTEAVCTSAGLMGEGRTVTVKLVTSWLKTGKLVKVVLLVNNCYVSC